MKKYGRGHHPNSRKNLLKEPTMEARSKGGHASVAVQRKKKEIQQVARYLMDLPIQEGETVDELTNLMDARTANLTVREKMVLAQVVKALAGDTQSFKAIVEASGEIPKEQFDPADEEIVPSFRHLLLGGGSGEEQEEPE